MINLKTKEEIALMSQGGKKLSSIMEKLKESALEGVETKKLNEIAERLIEKEGGKPSFKGYKGFPAALCTSVNNIVVHGIPSSYRLKEGDLLSLDLGMLYKGFHTDMAITFPIGEVDQETLRLVRVTKKALKLAVKKSRVGNTLGDVGETIERYIRRRGFFIVEGLCGHGIGREVHEDPQIPNTGKRGRGLKIEEGMTFCIEPMVSINKGLAKETEEGFVTEKKSAHFEYTLAIVEGKAKILTL